MRMACDIPRKMTAYQSEEEWHNRRFSGGSVDSAVRLVPLAESKSQAEDYLIDSKNRKRKHSGADTTSAIEYEVEDEDIVVIYELIHLHSDKWYDIGLVLGFVPPELNSIHGMPKLLLGAQGSYLKEMLSQWCQWPTDRHPHTPTIEALCRTLCNSVVGLGKVAAELKQKFDEIKLKRGACLKYKPKRQKLEDKSLIQAIRNETKAIKLKFAGLQQEIRTSITNKLKDRRVLVAIVSEMEILSEDDMRRVTDAPDTLGVYLIIKNYWSLLDYTYFAFIVRTLCGERENKMLEEYTAALEKFCRNRIVDCPYDDSESKKKIYVKLDTEVLKKDSKRDHTKFTCWLANILHCEASDLELLSIEEGSILITFLVVSFVGDRLFEKGCESLSIEQQDALRTECVITLKYESITIFSNTQTSVQLTRSVSDSGILCRSGFDKVDHRTKSFEDLDLHHDSMLSYSRSGKLVEGGAAGRFSVHEQTLSHLDTQKGEHLQRYIQCQKCRKFIKYDEFAIEIHLSKECRNHIVHCTNASVGCDWTGTQKELHAHLDTCEFDGLVQCPYHCAKIISTRNLQYHCRECTARTIPCLNESKGCHWNGRLTELNEHMKECCYQELEYPNLCCELVRRDHITYNKDDECKKRTSQIDLAVNISEDCSSISETKVKLESGVHKCDTSASNGPEMNKLVTRHDTDSHLAVNISEDCSSVSETKVNLDSGVQECDASASNGLEMNKFVTRHDSETHLTAEECTSSIICCTNAAIGCDWRGELCELSAHTQICDFNNNMIKCPNLCGKMILRNKLENHLKDKCPNRNVPCRNAEFGCLWTGRQDKLDAHELMCKLNSESVLCPYKCGGFISRQNLEHHIINECPQRTIQTTGCIWIEKLNDLSTHEEEYEHHLLPCPNKCGQLVQRQQLEVHKQEECPKRRVLCDNVREGCFWKGPHSELAAHKKSCDSTLFQQPGFSGQTTDRNSENADSEVDHPDEDEKRVASHDISAEKSMINVDSMIDYSHNQSQADSCLASVLPMLSVERDFQIETPYAKKFGAKLKNSAESLFTKPHTTKKYKKLKDTMGKLKEWKEKKRIIF